MDRELLKGFDQERILTKMKKLVSLQTWFSPTSMVGGSLRALTNLTSLSVAAAQHCAEPQLPLQLLPEGPPQAVTSALWCLALSSNVKQRVREWEVAYLTSPVCSLHLPSSLVNGVFPVNSERWELNLILVTFLRRLLKKVILYWFFNSINIWQFQIYF